MPDKPQIFVAQGAALLKTEAVITFAALSQRLAKIGGVIVHEVERLPALFENEQELAAFRARHQKACCQRRSYPGTAAPASWGSTQAPPPPNAR
ncbi:MAG: hypothetical protein ACLSAP_07555 [Oscillospiraceae bacterium]